MVEHLGVAHPVLELGHMDRATVDIVQVDNLVDRREEGKPQQQGGSSEGFVDMSFEEVEPWTPKVQGCLVVMKD